MRKKSAFLERLTARAAAAFEAGGSYGAYGSDTGGHSPSQDASMPSGAASLHEPSVRYSAQADKHKPALFDADVTLSDSSVELHTELSTELDSGLHTTLNAELGTQEHVEQSTQVNTVEGAQLSTQVGVEVHTSPSSELDTELNIEPHTQVSSELSLTLSTQAPTQQSTELHAEPSIQQDVQQDIQSTQLHTQDCAKVCMEPRALVDSSAGLASDAEHDTQRGTPMLSPELDIQGVAQLLDVAEELPVLDEDEMRAELSTEQNAQQFDALHQPHTPNPMELSTEQSTQVHTQAHAQIHEQIHSQPHNHIDRPNPTELNTQQNTQVHTEQSSHCSKEAEPVSVVPTTEASVEPSAMPTTVYAMPSVTPVDSGAISGTMAAIAPNMASNVMLSIDSDEERVCASLGDVAKVLFAHLIAMEKNVLNMKRLHLYNNKNLPIPYTSIRTAWTRLKTLKIISHSVRHDIGKEKGVLFQLDGVYTFAFQKLYPHMLVRVRAGQSAGQSTQLSTELHTGLGARLGVGAHSGFNTGISAGLNTVQSAQLSIQPSAQLSTELDTQPNAYLSTQPNTLLSPQGTQLHIQPDAQLSTQLGTQGAPLTEIPKPKTKLEGHPEYAFWRDCGLSQTQCTRWKEEFGLDDLLLDNYLRWCAHDVGHDERKDKSGKAISNPANWFYTIMKKAGAYPKPEGYQSHEEKIFLVRENLLKEQAALYARQNDLRAQEERQEAEGLFAAFLEEGESSQQFHELCAKISPFLYENRHTRRRLFENALRTEYFAFLGIDAGHKD